MSCRIPNYLRVLWAGCLLAPGFLPGAETEPVDAQVRELIEQNRLLQEQVRAQAQTIEGLRVKVTALDQSTARHEQQLQALQGPAPDAPSAPGPEAGAAGEVRISSEASVAFFSSGSAGQFPKAEFRVDDAKIFLEAPIWKNVYLFSELDLITRESSDNGVYLGEFYADIENVAAAWGRDHLLNLRVGRFSIPFGEEYQRRNALDDPLVSHSLSDIWGFDEGVEIYGDLDGVKYVLAVQNGGNKIQHDYDSDKAVALRLGYDPAAWLHLSASAMRTGELDVQGDALSAVWFSGGFFRALGPAAVTTTFAANLFELDGTTRWKGGDLRAAAGYVHFTDNDRAEDDTRKLRYFYVEGTQEIMDRLFGAARYSEIRTDHGYPLVGQGDLGTYLFRRPPTDNLERLSLGLGYRFAAPLVLKLEYSLEWGRLSNGVERDKEDLLSTELGLKF